MSALLRTEDVRKAYGGVHALDACTVEIEEGSVAGLIGPNGSGKTTLFNVITGYASEILLGALFLLIVLFVPRGIVPTGGEWIRRLRTRGRPAIPPASQRPAAPSGLTSEEPATSEEGRRGLTAGRRRAGEQSLKAARRRAGEKI